MTQDTTVKNCIVDFPWVPAWPAYPVPPQPLVPMAPHVGRLTKADAELVADHVIERLSEGTKAAPPRPSAQAAWLIEKPTAYAARPVYWCGFDAVEPRVWRWSEYRREGVCFARKQDAELVAQGLQGSRVVPGTVP